MARESAPPLLAYINNARSHAEQTSALRSLKNDIVGHAQKKKTWVTHGILRPVVGILRANRSPPKINGKPSRSSTEPPLPLTDEENVRLQALQVLSSFANGGRPFVEPIAAVGAVPVILSNMNPDTNPPQIVVTALVALSNLAEAALHTTAFPPPEAQELADLLFSSESIHNLGEILIQSERWSFPVKQSPVYLVTTLISRLCRDDKSALALADSKVLDLLARELAGFAVASGHVIPGAEVVGRSDGRAEYIPWPAREASNLAPVLEAITSIVSDSRYRASRLLFSPAILAVFPNLKFTPAEEIIVPWKSLQKAGHGSTMHQSIGPIDCLLAATSHPHGRGSSPHQPFLALGPREPTPCPIDFSKPAPSIFGHGLPVHDESHQESANRGEELLADDIESPLIPWLIVLCRTCSSSERLQAAGLLTSLFKYGTGIRQHREASIGLLVVPVLVDLIRQQEGMGQSPKSTVVNPSTSSAWKICEQAPVVLSRLMTDSEVIREAAFLANAAKVLSKLLKDAYEPVPSSVSARAWSPHPDTGMTVESDSPDRGLGPEADPPLLTHKLRVRESSLKAIAALAAGKDEYRKAFVDQDVISYIVQSLTTTPGKPSGPKDRSKGEEADGPAPDPATSGYGSNPLSVVIAACHAVRVHSRSVSILRTSLVDHGVSLPILGFMKHPDVDVQIAATAAMCNLVTEVSPMRDLLMEKGAMRVLCEHAHSLTAALRLNAMWALKHLVHAVGTDVKKQCLEDLESGWLVQLICDDTEDDALYKSKQEKQMSADRASIDLDLDDDVEMDPNETPTKFWYGSTGIPRDVHGRVAAWALSAETRTTTIREAELNLQRKARNDDLVIQEQGLDFIRNLIGATGAVANPELVNESTEMIDYLFNALGQDRFFSIMAKKLQAKFLHPSKRSGFGSIETRVLYPQSKVVEAVIYIMVHIAASVPRHRQLVIVQTDLLRLLANHFSSRDKDIRSALCALISNLTWQDDDSDARACGLRAHELKKMGVLNKLEKLEDDGELDVRERAKSAVWQMKQATY